MTKFIIQGTPNFEASEPKSLELKHFSDAAKAYLAKSQRTGAKDILSEDVNKRKHGIVQFAKHYLERK